MVNAMLKKTVGNRLIPIYTIGTVKHGSGKGLMIWGGGVLFSIFWIWFTLPHRRYLLIKKISWTNTYIVRWTFQQDNDSKHTSELVKEEFNTNKILCNDLT